METSSHGTTKLSGQNATNFQDIEAPAAAASPVILMLDMLAMYPC